MRFGAKIETIPFDHIKWLSECRRECKYCKKMMKVGNLEEVKSGAWPVFVCDPCRPTQAGHPTVYQTMF